MLDCSEMLHAKNISNAVVKSTTGSLTCSLYSPIWGSNWVKMQTTEMHFNRSGNVQELQVQVRSKKMNLGQ